MDDLERGGLGSWGWFVFFRFVGVLFAALMLSACDAMIPRFEPIRYKLQAEVETPAGLKTGYSVIEVRLEKSLRGFKVKGEAAAVDVAPGQTLFVVLRSPQTFDWAAQAINIFPGTAKLAPGETGHEADVRRTGRALDAKRADRRAYPAWVRGNTSADPEKSWPGTPYLVRFKDIGDPKSVERVDPDDLAKTFGPGFKLKSLTVQVTDDPVTTGIHDRLPWLQNHAGSLVKSAPKTPISEIPPEQRLDEGAFAENRW